MKYYITGDCHGDFHKIQHFVTRVRNTSKDDVLIILGDAGINFTLDKKDKIIKELLVKLPITLFCIHGNHEERPCNILSYKTKLWHGGMVYYEEEYPNILFAKDGEIFDFNGKKALVIGGAYSVDKYFRLMAGIPWFESEQPSEEMKQYVENKLDCVNWKVDYVLSHTCPLKYRPNDLLIKTMENVDSSTEEWLDDIEKKLTYSKWYFGHFHENRRGFNTEMLFEVVKELGAELCLQKVGRPVFKKEEPVFFYFSNGKNIMECYGKIEVVDSYGCLEIPSEVCYDIYGRDYRNGNEMVLYKHIPESDIESLDISSYIKDMEENEFNE